MHEFSFFLEKITIKKIVNKYKTKYVALQLYNTAQSSMQFHFSNLIVYHALGYVNVQINF